jgi:hypothetical protein
VPLSTIERNGGALVIGHAGKVAASAGAADEIRMWRCRRRDSSRSIAFICERFIACSACRIPESQR